MAGWWPYRCESCALRFYLRCRYLPEAPAPPATESAAGLGPAMAFRTDAVRPQARIVVEADSHEQLSHILMALDRAVGTYQRQSSHGTTSGATQRTAREQDRHAYSAR